MSTEIVYEVFDGNQKLIGFSVYCSACKGEHLFDIGRWTFDGNRVKPTFTPSMHVRCNTPDMVGYQPEAGSSVCHSFIKNGNWEYLNDCTHELAGKIIPIEQDPYKKILNKVVE